jgi:hypothetical protein
MMRYQQQIMANPSETNDVRAGANRELEAARQLIAQSARMRAETSQLIAESERERAAARQELAESQREREVVRNFLDLIERERAAAETSEEADQSFYIDFRPTVGEIVESDEPHRIFSNFSAFRAKIPEILETMRSYRDENTFDSDVDAFVFPENQEAGDIGGFQVEGVFIESPSRPLSETFHDIISAFGEHIPVSHEQNTVSVLPERDFGTAYEDPGVELETNYFGYKLNDEYHLRMYQTRFVREDGNVEDYWKVILLSEFTEEQAARLQERTKACIFDQVGDDFRELLATRRRQVTEAENLGTVPDMLIQLTIPEMYYPYISAEDVAAHYRLVPVDTAGMMDGERSVPSARYFTSAETEQPSGLTLYVYDDVDEISLYAFTQEATQYLLEKFEFPQQLEASIAQRLSQSSEEDLIVLDPSEVIRSLLPEQSAVSIDAITRLYYQDYLRITSKYVPAKVQRVLERLFVPWLEGRLDIDSAKIEHIVEEAKNGEKFIWKVGFDPYYLRSQQCMLARLDFHSSV